MHFLKIMLKKFLFKNKCKNKALHNYYFKTGPELKLKCEIPKNQPNGKFHCYNDSEIGKNKFITICIQIIKDIFVERCFLMCKPGYVPKLYTGKQIYSNTF